MLKRLATLGQAIGRWPLLGRISCFLGLLLLLWLPIALPLYGLGAYIGAPETVSVLVLVALALVFIGISWCWGAWVKRWRYPLQGYGLALNSSYTFWLAAALLCGLAVVLALFALEVWWGWAYFYPQLTMTIVLSGLGVGLGVGLLEEWFFRGWLLSELRTEMGLPAAAAWSGLIFAAAHFIKPLPDILATSPQFFGLLLLGVILAQLRYVASSPARSGSLAWPIGFHGGLVWGYYMIDVADLVIPSARVPDWVTGIHGNPLSGILGLGSLMLVWAAVTICGRWSSAS